MMCGRGGLCNGVWEGESCVVLCGVVLCGFV